MKNPFIELYLEEYDDNKVKEIITQEKCNVINYEYITKNTIFDDYDYVIINGMSDLHYFNEDNNELFDKLNKQNKLFYVGEYTNIGKINYKNYENFYNLKIGFNVSISLLSGIIDTLNFMSNLLINISFTISKGLRPVSVMQFCLGFLPSSIAILDIETIPYLKNKSFCNLPNKIKILNFKCFGTHKNVKYPKNIILVVFENNHNRYPRI